MLHDKAQPHRLRQNGDPSWLWPRRIDRTGWEERIDDLRLLAGEAVQKGGDLVYLLLAQFGTELTGAHHGDGLAQIPRLTRVEIRRRQGNVTQGRYLEDIFIAWSLGDLETTLVSRRQDIRARLFNDTKRGVLLTPDIDAAVAASAAFIEKELQA